MKRKILIATSNPGKLRDFAGAAARHGVEIAGIPDFSSLPTVVEDGLTFEANARKKAEAALRHSEQRYRHLFHHMPVALLQINVRARIELIKGLCAEGVTDLGAYLDQHPGFLRRAMDACVVEEDAA